MKILVFLTGLILSASAFADISQLKLELLLAKRGDLSAQYRVAVAYEHGTDIKKNMEESIKWYLKAANQSHASSQYKAGYFYEHGLGVARDMAMAMYWYKEAKNNGSDEAIHRLDKTAFEKHNKAAIQQRLALQAKSDKEDKLRKAKAKRIAQKKTQIKKQQKVAVKPVKKVVTNKKRTVFKVADLVKVVLNNKWKNKHGAADYLPSASTACLESGDKELTCFSSEKSRKIKGTNITYTTKSTLMGFKSNGSFKVIYNYNGLNIAGAKTKASDIYGLKMKEGWQEPAVAVKCRVLDRKKLSCFRGGKKITFRH